MGATIIDGRRVAAGLRARLGDDLVEVASTGARVGLATVAVGHAPASQAYERSLRTLATSVGCPFRAERLAGDAEADEVLATIGKLNTDPRISGVLILRPLPGQIDEEQVYRLLDPAKDVEAVTAANAGLMAQGMPRFLPSTPASCFHLLDHHLRATGRDPATALTGATITVVGRSHNVGKPTLWLAFERGATVISCDKHASDAGTLAGFTAQADVLIVAAGVPGLVRGDMVKPGAIVIDVGINTVPDPDNGRTRLVGDVDFASVSAVAGAVTPVPGGVGPVTDVWVIRNTLAAAVARHGGRLPSPWEALR